MKTLSIAQASYLAGFIDGDGSIFAQIIRRNDYVLKFQIRVSVTCFQKSNRIHLLKDFEKEIGVGVTRDRGDGIAEFSLVGSKNVSSFLQQIQPYLRNKKKQANLILRLCEQINLTKNDPQKFLELCEIADRVAELNDSKNRTMMTREVKNHFLDLGLINP